jgi:hypothetical protein
MNRLPLTSELSEQIDSYLAIMARRRRNMSDEEALEALLASQLRKDVSENSLLLVSEEDELEDRESEALVNAFLNADPAMDLPEPDASAQPRLCASAAAEGQRSSSWLDAKRSVAGATTNLAASLRGGLGVLKPNRDEEPGKDSQGVHKGGAEADRSFDESLTA